MCSKVYHFTNNGSRPFGHKKHMNKSTFLRWENLKKSETTGESLNALKTAQISACSSFWNSKRFVKSNFIVKHSGKVDHFLFKLDKAQTDITNLESWFIVSTPLANLNLNQKSCQSGDPVFLKYYPKVNWKMAKWKLFSGKIFGAKSKTRVIGVPPP